MIIAGGFATVEAAPAVLVAINVIAVNVPTEAFSAFAPTVAPRVQLTVATPDAFVLADAALTDPPPLNTRKLTTAPDRGAPFWSLTRTEGAGATAVAATPVSVVDENATIVVGTDGSTGFSPLQAMYPSNKTAGATLKELRMDRFTAPAFGIEHTIDRVPLLPPASDVSSKSGP